MGAFDFSKAQVDPWATMNLMEKYYVVSIRLNDGQGIFSLVRTDKGERSAVMQVLGNIRITDLNQIKDVRAILLTEMRQYDDVASMFEDITGMELSE